VWVITLLFLLSLFPSPNTHFTLYGLLPIDWSVNITTESLISDLNFATAQLLLYEQLAIGLALKFLILARPYTFILSL
jgi:hypothetical protein